MERGQDLQEAHGVADLMGKLGTHPMLNPASGQEVP